MEAREKIRRLEEYKSYLSQWQRTNDPPTRSLINQNTAWVRRELIEARCFSSLTLTPPAITGGLIMENVDPFLAMFDPPYGQNLFEVVVDMIDRCIGVLKAGHVPGENKAKIEAVQTTRDLHPEIYEKCRGLFLKGAYAEAAEKGFKVVRDRLRKLTGFETGSEAFGKGGLYVKGAAAPNVDHDFNDGVKFLTMAIDRFRNEKSHTSDAEIDDPARAYEYLRLSSLAMHLLDSAEVRH